MSASYRKGVRKGDREAEGEVEWIYNRMGGGEITNGRDPGDVG